MELVCLQGRTPTEPGRLQGRSPSLAIYESWFPRLPGGHCHFEPALALSGVVHLPITGGNALGVSVDQMLHCVLC